MTSPATDTTPSTKETKDDRRPTATRLPSLNQLAARINAAQSPTAPVARPRLAAALLRTGSTASLNTVVSDKDSIAVNAPSSRAESPALSVSSVAATPPSGPSGMPEGEPLTSENVEQLEEQTGQTPVATEKKIRGYKNIPSLDAITARLAKARTLSVDGTAQPPEPEMIEHPKTPGLRVKAPEHPLEHTWTMYHDQKAPYSALPPTPAPDSVMSPGPAGTAAGPPIPAEKEDYEAGLSVVGDFDTVESFCRYFNWLKPPSKLERNSNYHLFKRGIKPMWEDPANANGGKWVLTMKGNPPLLDRCWAWAAMALVGEELDEGDEICGVVVSLRAKVDRIQLWTRSKDDVEKLNGIAKRFVKILDISEADNIGLEFQFNSDDRPPMNKFLSIQSMPVTGYRSSFRNSPTVGPGDGPASASATTPAQGPNSAAANATTFSQGGGGGAFGQGGGGGAFGSAWRPKQR